MTLFFTLNHQPISVKAPANRRASEIFHTDLRIQSLDPCCHNGSCGKCMVLLDNKLVLSCLVPAFSLREKNVLTLEGLKQMEEYQDIKRAQEKMGIRVCNQCSSLVMLTTQSILQGDIPPTKWDIMGAFTHYNCSCSSIEALTDFVQEARAYRRGRRSARQA